LRPTSAKSALDSPLSIGTVRSAATSWSLDSEFFLRRDASSALVGDGGGRARSFSSAALGEEAGEEAPGAAAGAAAPAPASAEASLGEGALSKRAGACAGAGAAAAAGAGDGKGGSDIACCADAGVGARGAGVPVSFSRIVLSSAGFCELAEAWLPANARPGDATPTTTDGVLEAQPMALGGGGGGGEVGETASHARVSAEAGLRRDVASDAERRASETARNGAGGERLKTPLSSDAVSPRRWRVNALVASPLLHMLQSRAPASRHPAQPEPRRQVVAGCALQSSAA
jgi:hypothetical protein